MVGNTFTLHATTYPDNATNRAVLWKSSDSSVVEVDTNGRVTAVKAGTAVVTVATVDGGFTATCTITVEDPPLMVRASIGYTISASASGTVRGVSVEADASGGSGNYVEYYVRVYFNGELVAQGAKKEILVTAASGTYTAEVYVKDSNGNEATGTGQLTFSG